MDYDYMNACLDPWTAPRCGACQTGLIDQEHLICRRCDRPDQELAERNAKCKGRW